jgi:flagellar biosynthesis GTPase FlhF
LPTQRFEAPSLEQAVRIVRAEAGPTARIVGATRVRRGGVGGFFAREHVELEVEVIEGSEAAPPRPKPAGTGPGRLINAITSAPSRGAAARGTATVGGSKGAPARPTAAETQCPN